jgi:hypothetical protein
MTTTTDLSADTPTPAPTTSSDAAARRRDELPRRPVRKPLGPLALVITTLLVASGAFYGGVIVEKGHVESTSSTAAAAAGLAARQRGASGTAVTGATGGGAGALQGTITLIDGANVYVTDSSGNIDKVVTSPQTQITATVAGTVQTLHPGDSVTVSGPTDTNGQLQATVLRDTGAPSAGGTSGRAGGSSGATPSGATSAAPGG